MKYYIFTEEQLHKRDAQVAYACDKADAEGAPFKYPPLPDSIEVPISDEELHDIMRDGSVETPLQTPHPTDEAFEAAKWMRDFIFKKINPHLNNT